MNKQKDRLVELIGSKVCEEYSPNCDEYEPHTCEKCYANFCKVGDLADAILADGWMRPPCKVGDTVYEICFGKLSGQKTIKQSKVTAIKITDKITITLDYTTNLYDTDIGRWFFVGKNAKEEAEAKLKGGVQG